MSDKRTLGREEEAAQDLPHTQFGRGSAWLLALGFLLSILSIPLWEFFGPRAPQTTPEKPYTWLPPGRTIPEGYDFQQLEGHLEDSSAVWRKVRPPMQAQLTQLAQAGNSQVVVGQKGWLFYRLAVEHLIGAPFLDPAELARREKAGVTNPDPVYALSNFANQLRRRGIQLIVMPVPVKAAIYPDKLRAEYNFVEDGTPENPSMEKFKRVLEDRGILVFDPTETLRLARRFSHQLQYFPTDTHWTPAGAAASGVALGSFISQWVKLPLHTFTNYKTRPITQTASTDLVRLLGLPANQTLYHSPDEAAEQVVTQGGWMVNTDPNADILLLGDSFGGSYAAGGAGLSAHLTRRLGRPVATLTHPNGGSWQTRKELVDEMKKGNDPLAGKKLVVYEFTARDLSSGNWIPFTLPSPEEVAAAKVKATSTPVGQATPAPSATGTVSSGATPLPTPSAASTPLPGVPATGTPLAQPSSKPLTPSSTPTLKPSAVTTPRVVATPRIVVPPKPSPTRPIAVATPRPRLLRRPVVRVRATPTPEPEPTPNLRVARARRLARAAARRAQAERQERETRDGREARAPGRRTERSRSATAREEAANRPTARPLPPPAEAPAPVRSQPQEPSTSPAAPPAEAPASSGA